MASSQTSAASAHKRAPTQPPLSLDEGAGSVRIRLAGAWSIDEAQLIEKHIASVRTALKQRAGVSVCSLDLEGVVRLDTTGAILVRRLATLLVKDGWPVGDERGQVAIGGMSERHQHLLSVISECPKTTSASPDNTPWYEDVLVDMGTATLQLLELTGSLLSFIGLVVQRLVGLVAHPSRLRFTATVHQIDMLGVRALWIVGLIAFLVGAVMTNQGAVQLAKFGADIFVIDLIGISQLRELGVLMTSIIIAGRSGSAFTAQIGSMKLHEEIDALRTMGLNPVDVLVLPRVVGLMIALPLLTFYADIVGLMGGALMGWLQLGVTPANFIYYFQEEVPYEHLFVGLIKAPFFAAVIAMSGCYEGFKVARSADSLGTHTTRSVVQSIFMVIALDALFALFFTAVGL